MPQAVSKNMKKSNNFSTAPSENPDLLPSLPAPSVSESLVFASSAFPAGFFSSSQPVGIPGEVHFSSIRIRVLLSVEKPESKVIAQAATKKRRYDEPSFFALFFTSIG